LMKTKLSMTATLILAISGCGGNAPATVGDTSQVLFSDPTAPPWPYVDAGCPAPAEENVAFEDSGAATWGCVQVLCAQGLVACGADCTCNNEIRTALACSALEANADTCFLYAFGDQLPSSEWSGLLGCIINSSIECVQTDGGIAAQCADAAPSTDSGCPVY
jgi:hypothetical protein